MNRLFSHLIRDINKIKQFLGLVTVMWSRAHSKSSSTNCSLTRERSSRQCEIQRGQDFAKNVLSSWNKVLLYLISI